MSRYGNLVARGTAAPSRAMGRVGGPTSRFLLIARAGRLARIAGRQVLRMTGNPVTQTLYDRVAHALGA